MAAVECDYCKGTRECAHCAAYHRGTPCKWCHKTQVCGACAAPRAGRVSSPQNISPLDERAEEFERVRFLLTGKEP